VGDRACAIWAWCFGFVDVPACAGSEFEFRISRLVPRSARRAGWEFISGALPLTPRHSGALTPEAQHAGNGGFGAVGLHTPVKAPWGRCPQAPGIYRFGPEAGFRRGVRGGFSHIRLLRLPCEFASRFAPAAWQAYFARESGRRCRRRGLSRNCGDEWKRIPTLRVGSLAHWSHQQGGALHVRAQRPAPRANASFAFKSEAATR
jgi:hypothetical protein